MTIFLLIHWLKKKKSFSRSKYLIFLSLVLAVAVSCFHFEDKEEMWRWVKRRGAGAKKVSKVQALDL